MFLAALCLLILAAVVGFLAPRAQTRTRASLRMSAVQGDNLLMAATAALQAGDAEGAIGGTTKFE